MSNSQSIEITVQLDRSDLSQANSAIALGRLKLHGWIAFTVSIAFLSALFCRWVLSEWTEFQDSWFLLLLGGLFGAAFGPGFLFATIRVSSFIAAKSLVRNTPALQGPTRWTFSDAGIRTDGPTAQSEVQWKSFTQIRETKRQFLLYPQNNIAYVVPKRCFSTVNEMVTFREMVRKRFPSAKLQVA